MMKPSRILVALGVVLAVILIWRAKGMASWRAQRPEQAAVLGDDDCFALAAALAKEVAHWQSNTPLPPRLLEYRSSRGPGLEWDALPNPAGTHTLFSSITNKDLLFSTIFAEPLDTRVFDVAVARCLEFEGPTEFFRRALAQLGHDPKLLQIERFQSLLSQAQTRHVVVDGLFINRRNLSPSEVTAALAGLKQELESGSTWAATYRRWADRYSLTSTNQFYGGTTRAATRTKIGNLGDFIIPENGNPTYAFRMEWLPLAHVPILVEAKPGTICILAAESDHSLARPQESGDAGERMMLYQIREVYEGKQ